MEFTVNTKYNVNDIVYSYIYDEFLKEYKIIPSLIYGIQCERKMSSKTKIKYLLSCRLDYKYFDEDVCYKTEIEVQEAINKMNVQLELLDAIKKKDFIHGGDLLKRVIEEINKRDNIIID